MPRKTKLTQEIQNKIIQAIQAGATYDLCAQYAGISPATFYSWMKQGREGKDKTKIEFLENIKRAESRGAIANLGLIQKAATDGDWKASAWLLERRHGYSRNNLFNKQASEADSKDDITEMSTKQVLQSQLRSAIKASNEALGSGSYQAFAALQRQTVSIALQLKNLDAESSGDMFDMQSDEDLLEQISQIILSLPPVLQQRLSQDIVSIANHKLSSTIVDA